MTGIATGDVSSEYIQFRAMQKATLGAREGQILTDRRTKMHQQMETMDAESKAAMIRHIKQKDTQSSTCSLPQHYPSSVASLEELMPIQIKDLRIETHHRGNYLLVKGAIGPYRLRALIAVVEDELGEGSWRQLYQQPDESTQPALNIIAKGDVFIIKELWPQVGGDGEYSVRIDHLGDLIRIDACHKL